MGSQRHGGMDMERGLPVRIILLTLFVLVAVSFNLSLAEGSISSEHEGYLGSAGDDVEIKITVTNEGNATDTAMITVDETNGWPVALPADFNVDAGESEERTITVSIPDDALATEPDLLEITVEFENSGETDTQDVQVDVEQVYELDASLFSYDLHAAPGRRFTIHLMLSNLGNGDDLVECELYAPYRPGGQDRYLYIHEEFSLLMGPGQTGPHMITATISPMAEPNDTFAIVLYANSSEQSHEMNVNVTIDDYDTWVRSLEATMEAHGEVVGESIEAVAKIGTLYASPTSTAYVADLTLSIHTSEAQGKALLDFTTLAATKGDFDGDTLTLTLDYLATPGEYVIRATIEKDTHDNKTATWEIMEETITLVEPEYAFDLRCIEDEIGLRPDDTVHTFDVVIENTGNVADTFIIEILSDDIAEVYNTGIQTVAVGPNEEVHIQVTFDPTVQMGKFIAGIRVESLGSDDVQTLSVKATVAEAEEDPADEIPYDIIIPGIIVGALVAFVFGTEVGWLALLAFVPLYYRVTGKQVLDNYVRGKIHGYVIANPGDHYNGIKGNLGINNGTLAYHLKVLERENYLKSRMDGKYKRYYPYESMIPSKKKLSPIQKLLVEKLKNNPGISQRKLGKLAGESVQVVNYHMKQLEDAEVVKIEKLGNRSKCCVNENWK